MAKLTVALLAFTFVCAIYTGSAQVFPPAPRVAAGPSPAATASAPGASAPSSGFNNIYDYLNSRSQYSELVELINATPSSPYLLSVLDAACGNSTPVTFLAPTNDGINKSLAATRPPTTAAALASNGAVLTQILLYHIIPNPLPYKAFGNGNSFNTQAKSSTNAPLSVLVGNTGRAVTITGGTNSAQLADTGVSVCAANPSIVYALDGILIPTSVAGSAATPPPTTTTRTGSSGSR